MLTLRQPAKLQDSCPVLKEITPGSPQPLREELAESRNAVAIWITEQIGIDSVIQTSRNLGVQTPLQPYAMTALGASEVNLLELANAYRAMASGISAQP